MIVITKAERERVLEQFPRVHIVRAKHHYYCEEDPRVMRMLGRITTPPRTNNKKKRNGQGRNNDWKRTNNER